MNIQKIGAINSFNTPKVAFGQESENKAPAEQKHTTRNLTIAGLAIGAIVLAGFAMRSKPKDIVDNAQTIVEKTEVPKKHKKITKKGRMAHAKKIGKLYENIDKTKGKVKRESEFQYVAKKLQLEKAEALKAKATQAKEYAEKTNEFYANFDKTKGKVKEYSIGQYNGKRLKLEKASA